MNVWKKHSWWALGQIRNVFRDLEPYYSQNKMAYFRTFVGNFRKWRHTWHYRTARHSQKVGIHAAECQIPPQSRFALINRHFYASLTRTTRWNSRKKMSPVSCVTSQLGARPWVCFRKIIGKCAYPNQRSCWLAFSVTRRNSVWGKPSKL